MLYLLISKPFLDFIVQYHFFFLSFCIDQGLWQNILVEMVGILYLFMICHRLGMSEEDLEMEMSVQEIC